LRKSFLIAGYLNHSEVTANQIVKISSKDSELETILF